MPRYQRGAKSMLYISGPITGDRDYKQKFKAAKRLLEAQGYDVVNPAELDDVLPVRSMTHEEIMRTCLDILLQCDAVVTLPGWETSLGCQREVGFAEGADKIVLPIQEFLR